MQPMLLKFLLALTDPLPVIQVGTHKVGHEPSQKAPLPEPTLQRTAKMLLAPAPIGNTGNKEKVPMAGKTFTSPYLALLVTAILFGFVAGASFAGNLWSDEPAAPTTESPLLQAQLTEAARVTP